jgi:4-hydroxy-tetrahydrodipicolinate reductase
MSNPPRVVVAGAAGRLGSLAAEHLAEHDSVASVTRLVRGDDAAALLNPDQADVLLDLTVLDASRELANLAASRGIAPVVGTSGWSPDDVAGLRATCADSGIGGLIVPNFSIGAALQLLWAEQAASWFEDAAIHEVHHLGKRDRPSGTARRAAERMAAQTGRAVGINSARRADAVAEQSIVFRNPSERVELLHVVTDRRVYLPGIVWAVERVRALTRLEVGLDHLLRDRLGAPPTDA